MTEGKGSKKSPRHLATSQRVLGRGNPESFDPLEEKKKNNYKCDANTKMNIYLE